jgi:hypothetical protein
MQIDFAFERVFRLKVDRNDDDSWDFGRVDVVNPLKRPLLDLNSNKIIVPQKQPRIYHSAGLLAVRPEMEEPYGGVGRVCMVYELPINVISVHHLMNILCLYGDVIRVRFLNSKPGCAMVEMANSQQAEAVIQILSGRCTLFGQDVVIRNCANPTSAVLAANLITCQALFVSFLTLRRILILTTNRAAGCQNRLQ